MKNNQDLKTINKPAGIDVRSPAGLERVKALFEQQQISPETPPDSSLESIAISGGVYTFLATGEDTYGQYALFDFLVPPEAGPPPHIHTREDEVFYVVDGEINFQVGNQVFTGTAGDFIPYTRGQVHAFKNLGTEPARMLVIAAPAGLENFFRQAGQPVSDPSNIPVDNIPKVVAVAPNFGLELYPEAALIGKPIIEDGGITLYGDERSEILIGSEGSDLIIGRNGEDRFYGEQGNDTIIGGTGRDLIYGGEGDDLLSGREGNDTLTGGGDQDTFIVRRGAGTDTITDFGGVGTGVTPSDAVIAEVDTLKFEGPSLSAENMLLNQDENDLIITFEGVENTGVILQDFALENLDNLTKATGASEDIGNILFDGQTKVEDSFDVFNANQQRGKVFNKNSVTFLNDLDNNTQGFNDSNDVINGQGGNDKLKGLSGDDLLRGGTGNDILKGGRGDDLLWGGTGNDILKGGRGDDLLRGGTGNDILTGGRGDDLLRGGTGNDILTGGSGRDRFVLAAGAGTDTITDFTSDQDLIELSAGLGFAELKITQGTHELANDTLVSLTTSNELLAILTGVEASTITSTDFSIV
ncbi:hypothetical protein BJP34_12155 [Moorena producens PAL-8-15-08-1]|uniref:Cupin type-2 domain-containing protein n=1 Tax=Moorena producens PAL-8-15-08-1 TaxID=1458985 RepID=A0A1D8TR62_9CYAN|nr:cupin domain-containing protein [Moorena producens]AOX00097.1 hypothetical protein BJP34_12155 [Moorena producens PAL-8-15-08-1]